MNYIVLVDDQVLYKSDTNDPTYEILSPQLECELNKSSSFSFTVLESNWLYNQLKPLKSVVRVLSNERELFRGRIVSYETDIFGQRSVNCEDALSYLMDSVFLPIKAASKTSTSSSGSSSSNSSGSNLSDISSLVPVPEQSNNTNFLGKLWNGVKTTYGVAKNVISAANSGALETWMSGYFPKVSTTSSSSSSSSSSSQPKETAIEFLNRVLVSHNSQVETYKQIWPGRVTIDERNLKKEYGSDSITDTRSVIDNALINQYGGFLQLRYVEDVAYLDYLKEAGTTTSQVIQAGINLEEINYTEDTENIFSVLMPLGKDNGTIANANGGSFFLENKDYINRYGRIVRVKQWSDLTKAADVKEMGQKYMDKYCSGVPINMDVKAIDLHLIDSSEAEIKVGSKIRVYAPKRKIDVIRTVTKVSLDLQNPQNNSYTISDFESSQDDSTAAYHMKDYRLTSLLGEVEKSGRITRNGLALDVKGLMDINAGEIRIQANSVAKEFSTKSTYKVGDIVRGPNGALWRCKKAIDTPMDMFDPEYWQETSVSEGLILIQSRIEEHQTQLMTIIANQTDIYTSMDNNKQAVVHIQDSVAPIYATGKSYTKGSYVMYNGSLYIAKTNISNSGTFDSSKWSKTTVGNGFVAVNGTLYAVEGKIEKLEATDITTKKLIADEITATKVELKDLIADSITGVKANITWMRNKFLTVNNLSVLSNLTASTMSINGSGEILGSLAVAGNITINEEVVATRTWVNNRGYITAAWVNNKHYATEDWVTNKNYLTSVNWSQIGNKPVFNTYTVVSRDGTVFQLYGP